MKNVIVLGASGNIAEHVIDILVKTDDINLTLFLRKKSRLRNKNVTQCRIIEGDVLDFNQLKDANRTRHCVCESFRRPGSDGKKHCESDGRNRS